MHAPLRAEIYVTSLDLAAAVGISPRRLDRLVRLGVVEPMTAEGNTFSASAAIRLRRMLRLRDELGVGLLSAAIIVDLLERLERLEAQLEG